MNSSRRRAKATKQRSHSPQILSPFSTLPSDPHSAPNEPSESDSDTRQNSNPYPLLQQSSKQAYVQSCPTKESALFQVVEFLYAEYIAGERESDLTSVEKAEIERIYCRILRNDPSVSYRSRFRDKPFWRYRLVTVALHFHPHIENGTVTPQRLKSLANGLSSLVQRVYGQGGCCIGFVVRFDPICLEEIGDRNPYHFHVCLLPLRISKEELERLKDDPKAFLHTIVGSGRRRKAVKRSVRGCRIRKVHRSFRWAREHLLDVYDEDARYEDHKFEKLMAELFPQAGNMLLLNTPPEVMHSDGGRGRDRGGFPQQLVADRQRKGRAHRRKARGKEQNCVRSALAMDWLLKSGKVTKRLDVARVLKVSPSTVTERLKLLKLSPEVIQFLDGLDKLPLRLSETWLRTKLLNVPQEEQMQALRKRGGYELRKMLMHPNARRRLPASAGLDIGSAPC